MTLAETQGSQWGQSFSYDGFGNLLSAVRTKGTAPELFLYPNPANNRLGSGNTYDANGNLTATDFLTMSYDVDNRMVESTHSLNGTDRYVYDPANRRVWKEARGYFNEMAANYNGLYFGVLEAVFNRIWPRIFQGFDYRGLDQVIERMKQHPIVLVPCHRSHFDYLILSYLFHANYLSPPHIAAGDARRADELQPLVDDLAECYTENRYPGFDVDAPQWPALRDQLRQVRRYVRTLRARLH